MQRRNVALSSTLGKMRRADRDDRCRRQARRCVQSFSCMTSPPSLLGQAAERAACEPAFRHHRRSRRRFIRHRGFTRMWTTDQGGGGHFARRGRASCPWAGVTDIRRPSAAGHEAIGHAALGQVIRRHLDQHFVAGQQRRGRHIRFLRILLAELPEQPYCRSRGERGNIALGSSSTTCRLIS